MIIPLGYAQVNLIYTSSAGRGAQNAFGIINAGLDSPNTVAGAVHTAWVAHIQGALTNDTVLDSIKVKLGPNDVGPDGEVSYGDAGSGAGDALPLSLCALIRKSTGLGGKHGRGRLYHPGLFTGDLVADTADLAAATVADLSSRYAAFAAALTAVTYTPVLLHTDSTAPTTITGWSCEQLVATQRRRVRK